jgi:hypothetical protein
MPVPQAPPAQHRLPSVPQSTQVIAGSQVNIPPPAPGQLENSQQLWFAPPQASQAPLRQLAFPRQVSPRQHGPPGVPHWVQVPLTHTSFGPQPFAPGQHGPPRRPHAVQVPLSQTCPPRQGVMVKQQASLLPPQAMQAPLRQTLPSAQACPNAQHSSVGSPQ